MSDNCPKCGAVVTSPSLPVQAPPGQAQAVPSPASPPAAAAEWSAEQLADALRPKAAKTPKAPAVGVEKAPERPLPAPALPDPVPSAALEVPHVGPPPVAAENGAAPEIVQATPAATLATVAAELAPVSAPQGAPATISASAPEVPAPHQESATAASPEIGSQVPVEAPPAKQDPDLFGAGFTFPPAPQIKGLNPEPSPPIPAESDLKPAAPATASRPATARSQEGRMRSKLQSISGAADEPAAGEPESKRKPAAAVASKKGTKPSASVAAAPPPAEVVMAPVASALVPETLPDEETAEAAAQPGMGEILATGASLGGPVNLPGQETRPWLHVPLVMVGSSPRRERRLRLNRIAMIGVVSFLLVDLLLLLWFCRKPIASWLSGPAQATVSPQPDSRSEARTGLGGTNAAPSSSPAAVVESPSVPPDLAPSTHNPATAVPEAAAKPVAEEAPVPMAIPVTDFPGEPNQASATVPPLVPTAAPVPAPAPDAMPAPAPPSVAALAAMPGDLPAPGSETAAASLPAPASTPEAPTTMTLANSPPPISPPQPGELPTAAGAMPEPSLAPGEVPYGGLPPPPPDMALPNGPIPDMSGPAVTLVTTPVASVRVSKLPKEAQTAVDVLKKFLEAPTWRDRLTLVQKADTLRAALDKNPEQFADGPIRVGQIDFVDRYVNKNGVPPYCMFELSGGSLEHPVLTLVEQSTKTGIRVDWEAFMDFKEDLMLKFLETKGAPNAKFRVMLRRKHYFDKDVPEVTSKDAFEVKQPHGHFQGHIFVPKKSALAQQLANQLGWGMDMPVIAELGWKTDGKNHWVEMTAITSYGWRGP
ncbi:hypothetical protein [Verrucomicrobium spinosum]|uniref:hypothetical protein n=1 Tax=Verrucomicrobium spinosum TaxID=2736 RepID=UPI0018DE2DCB|nr:hypothetical protein [Verrucomicrobium spinosum]